MIADYRSAINSAVLFSVVISLTALAPALFSMHVYDSVITGGNIATLIALLLIVLGSYVFSSVLEWARTGVTQQVALDLDRKLARQTYAAVFRQNLRSPYLANLATQDLTMIRQFIANGSVNTVLDFVWSPVFLLVICLVDLRLGLLALAGMALLGFLSWLNIHQTQADLDQYSKKNVTSDTAAAEALKNAEAIEAMGMFEHFWQRWIKLRDQAIEHQTQANNHANVIGSTIKGLRFALQSLAMAAAAYLVLSNQITIGGMIAITILFSRTTAPIEALAALSKSWSATKSSYQRLVKLAETNLPPETTSGFPKPRGQVSVENITVVQSRSPILQSINFTVEAGQCVAVLGVSGSGKSTLARAIVGAVPVASGAVRIDSINIAHWDRQELGPNIGYLPQDIELFPGTVAENIARFGEVDMPAVVAAAQLAGVHELISALPQGYKTLLGADFKLSGGQQQRVALARAVYQLPKIVVLDEPNSNLDEVGQAALHKTIAKLKSAGSTVIVISHRPQLLQTVDQAVVLAGGRVLAYDTREKIIEQFKSKAQR